MEVLRASKEVPSGHGAFQSFCFGCFPGVALPSAIFLDSLPDASLGTLLFGAEDETQPQIWRSTTENGRRPVFANGLRQKYAQKRQFDSVFQT